MLELESERLRAEGKVLGESIEKHVERQEEKSLESFRAKRALVF